MAMVVVFAGSPLTSVTNTGIVMFRMEFLKAALAWLGMRSYVLMFAWVHRITWDVKNVFTVRKPCPGVGKNEPSMPDRNVSFASEPTVKK